jgi:hypothetical protein
MALTKRKVSPRVPLDRRKLETMMFGVSSLAILALLLSFSPLPQTRRLPLPDDSWQPSTKPASQDAPADVMAVKRAASLARQAGRNRVAALAGSGNGAASANQLLAWGANQLLLPAVQDLARSLYLTRASWFNGQGRPVRDVLLLESRLPEPTRAVAEALLSLQRDFDLTDAETLSKQPEHAPTESPSQIFQVGEAHYGVVAVAPSDFWPENLLDLLLDYIKGGGRVVFLGRQPLSIQRLLFRTGVVRVGDAREDIERGIGNAVNSDFRASLGDTDDAAPSIRYQHRSDAKRDYYFVVNTDREHSVSVRLGIAVGGSIEEWDLSTGRVTPLRTPVKEISAGGSIALVVVR